jgi:hypothetical protein
MGRETQFEGTDKGPYKARKALTKQGRSQIHPQSTNGVVPGRRKKGSSKNVYLLHLGWLMRVGVDILRDRPDLPLLHVLRGTSQPSNSRKHRQQARKHDVESRETLTLAHLRYNKTYHDSDWCINQRGSEARASWG